MDGVRTHRKEKGRTDEAQWPLIITKYISHHTLIMMK